MCHAKIADLGLACLNCPSPLCLKCRSAGTESWMAPETVQEQVVDFPSDVFGMGLIFHELIFRNRELLRLRVHDWMRSRTQSPNATSRISLEVSLEREDYLNQVSAANIQEAFQLERNGKTTIPLAKCQKLSDLLKGMLRYRPNVRLTAEDALKKARALQSGSRWTSWTWWSWGKDSLQLPVPSCWGKETGLLGYAKPTKELNCKVGLFSH